MKLYATRAQSRRPAFIVLCLCCSNKKFSKLCMCPDGVQTLTLEILWHFTTSDRPPPCCSLTVKESMVAEVDGMLVSFLSDIREYENFIVLFLLVFIVKFTDTANEEVIYYMHTSFPLWLLLLKKKQSINT